jgi:hypothetical protein
MSGFGFGFGLGAPALNKGGLVPPYGFVFLTDTDGAYLMDTDGAYLLEAI